MNSPVYRDFAVGLRALNTTAPSPISTVFNGRRAYRKDSDLYLAPIHFNVVGENEDEHRNWRDKLERDDLRGPVYMGAAGMLNLEYISSARAGAAILFDVNAAQHGLWESMIDMLAALSERRDFIEFLKHSVCTVDQKLAQLFDEATAFALMRRENRKFGSGHPFRMDVDTSDTPHSKVAQWIENHKKSDSRSWMSESDKGEEKYAHLNRLAKNRALGCLTLDVTDEPACAQLREFLDNVEIRDENARVLRHGADIDVLYVSNIFAFLNGESDFTARGRLPYRWEQAKTNMISLLSPQGSRVISCDTNINFKNTHDYGPEMAFVKRPVSVTADPCPAF